MKSIFVYGWYGHNNLGDEAFKSAFCELWGNKAHFTFGDHIPEDVNEEYDACFVGGGSFLDQEISGLSEVRIPLGFIGVGLHSSIHHTNLDPLKKAKIVINRDGVNPYKDTFNSFAASDLVFARSLPPFEAKPGKEILILSNFFLTPMNTDSIWKQNASHWFLNEFPKVCDTWIREGYKLIFYPMCTGVNREDDRLAAAQIISKLECKSGILMAWGEAQEHELIALINASEFVVSTRYHGNVFSTILGKPFVGINHHDKMNNYFNHFGFQNYVNYYGFSIAEFKKALERSPVNQSTEYEKQRWRCLSGTVAERFGL